MENNNTLFDDIYSSPSDTEVSDCDIDLKINIHEYQVTVDFSLSSHILSFLFFSVVLLLEEVIITASILLAFQL